MLIKIPLKLKGFIFDLDGTLLDTAPDFVYAVNLMQSRANLNPTSLASLRPFVSEGINGLIQAAFGIDTTRPENAVLANELLKIYQENICRFFSRSYLRLISI